MNAILLFGILLEIFEKGIDGIYLSETYLNINMYILIIYKINQTNKN